MRLTAVTLGFLILWALWVIAARYDSMLTVADMRMRGFQRGIPLTGHWAMLAADVALPFLLGYLSNKYGSQWQFGKIVLMGCAAFLLSAGLHYTYVQAGKMFPEAPTHGGTLTVAGWLHLVYMTAAFTIIGLFYLGTMMVKPFDVWLTTVWLIAHVIIGVHVPMKVIAPPWFPYHGIWNLDTLGPIVGAAVVLIGLSKLALM